MKYMIYHNGKPALNLVFTHKETAFVTLKELQESSQEALGMSYVDEFTEYLAKQYEKWNNSYVKEINA